MSFPIRTVPMIHLGPAGLGLVMIMMIMLVMIMNDDDDDMVCYHSSECIGDMVCSVSEHVVG